MVGRDVEREGEEGGTEGESVERKREDWSREVWEGEVGEGGEGWTVCCEEGGGSIRGCGVVGREGEAVEGWEGRLGESVKEETSLNAAKVKSMEIGEVEERLRVVDRCNAGRREIHPASADDSEDLELWEMLKQTDDWILPFSIYYSVHQQPKSLENLQLAATRRCREGSEEVASSNESASSWVPRRKNNLDEER